MLKSLEFLPQLRLLIIFFMNIEMIFFSTNSGKCFLSNCFCKHKMCGNLHTQVQLILYKGLIQTSDVGMRYVVRSYIAIFHCVVLAYCVNIFQCVSYHNQKK